MSGKYEYKVSHVVANVWFVCAPLPFLNEAKHQFPAERILIGILAVPLASQLFLPSFA